ncbi:MAG: glycosyltransferase [Clostridia bacterium]|nr:glycosyltransferase [Clostridia bacterium]
MKFSLCIPMYNESSIIKETAATLHEYMSANFEDYEIIFSDDGSKDGCGDMVREMGLPCVRVVGYEQNMGKGYAVRTAMLAAEGDYVMFTDADLAYGTDVIKQVYETFLANPEASMVIGSRTLHKEGYEGYTAIRKLASKTYIKVLCIIGGFKLSDSQCGCKAFTGEAVKKIFPRCEINRFAFDFECILWAVKYGMKIAEMPVKIINHRESTVNVMRDAPKMVRDIIKMKNRIKKAKI